MANDISVLNSEKINIVSDFIRHAPPGEFNEVLNDVRVLVNDDAILSEGVTKAIAEYDRDQMIPVCCKDDDSCLITKHNYLGDDRYFNPKTKMSFKYNYIRGECTDLKPHKPTSSKYDSLREIIDRELSVYVEDHYEGPVSNVFLKLESDSNPLLVICIEAHQFQPKNFWNGRWRSEWKIELCEKQAVIIGVLKVQVHYYEDGNVQLVTSKEINENISLKSDEESAKEIIRLIEFAENEYQMAISECYQTMSDTTFRALRRLLPVTRIKFEWNNYMSYNIARNLMDPTT